MAVSSKRELESRRVAVTSSSSCGTNGRLAEHWKRTGSSRRCFSSPVDSVEIGISFLRIPSLCERARVCVCAPVCAVCLLLEFHSSFPTCAAHCCKYNTSFLNWFRYPVQRSTWTFSIKVMQLLSRASYIQEFKSWSSSFCVCVSLFYCFSLRLAAPAATSAVSFLSSSSSSWFSHINAMGGDKLLTLFFLLFFFGSVSWWSISIEWLTRTQIFFSFSFLLASRRQGGNGFWLIEPTNNCQLHLFIILKWNVRLVSLLGGWVGINSTWPKRKKKDSQRRTPDLMR